MADRLTAQQRHDVMSRIRGKNTKPEMIVRRRLFADGFRFRLHVKSLPGHPDIVLPKYKTVIFVHGCFWHRHENCKHFRMPASNIGYWTRKLEDNARRDERNAEEITRMGWKTIVVWECELEKKTRDDVMARMEELIVGKD